MNIVPKFQSGGNFSSLFTTYTPVRTNSPANYSQLSSQSKQETTSKKSDKSEDSEKGKLTEKELFSMIKDIDGLPNEMKAIIGQLKSTLDINNLVRGNTNGIANAYLSTLYKLKVANQNKAKFEESIKTAKESGSIGEVAITLGGNLLTSDKSGKIQEISLEQYQKNPEQYHLLTNSNVAWLRKYSPNMAFSTNDNAFEIIDNGMGFESFQKLLDQAKAALNTSSAEEGGIITKDALLGLKTLQGLPNEKKQELLNKANGLLSYDSYQESNINQIQSLIEYLTVMLPKRAKVWAATKIGKDSETSAKMLVTQYLMGSLKSTERFEIGSTKDSKNGDESSGMDKVDLNTPAKFLSGLGHQELFTLSPGTNRAVQVLANTMPLTDKQDKQIGVNATLQDALSGNYIGILDIKNASMGGEKINMSALNDIIIQDGKISSIDFPCIMKPNGEIIPNTNPGIFKAKQQADLELKRMGIDMSTEEDIKTYYKVINRVYKKYKLDPPYNPNGELQEKWKRFGVINVVANGRAIGLGELDDNPLLQEITDDATIDNLIEITKAEDFDKKGIISSFTGNYDRFYRGQVWIPLDVNYQSALVGTKTSGKDVENTEVAQKVIDAKNNWKTGPSI